MSDGSTTPARDPFDVEAYFRRCLKRRARSKGSAADRDRRIRAATREVEFRLGEWERDTGEWAHPARLRLKALSRAQELQGLRRVVHGLLRAIGLRRRLGT